MKKAIVVTILIAIILMMIIPNISMAGYNGIATNIVIGSSGKEELSKSITSRMLGRVQVVGSVISVIALIIIGIRYMFSTIEEKSAMKGVIGYYIVGAVLVFATSNILSIVYNILHNLT